MLLEDWVTSTPLKNYNYIIINSNCVVVVLVVCWKISFSILVHKCSIQHKGSQKIKDVLLMVMSVKLKDRETAAEEEEDEEEEEEEEAALLLFVEINVFIDLPGARDSVEYFGGRGEAGSNG